jgi:Secretion system C-terminal sorting domain
LVLLLFFLISNVFFGQITNSIDITPNGSLDNIFDSEGNQYRLSDINIENQINSNNSSRAAANLCTNTSYFDLIFEGGSGFENVPDPTQNAINMQRRCVIIKVFEDISNFIDSPLLITGFRVNIWVRNINLISSSPNSLNGLALSFYNLPKNNLIGGIADSEMWKTILSGKDSYTNVAAPLNLINNSGNFFHGAIAFNFNSLGGNPVVNWHTDLNSVGPSLKTDLYSVALHEITHALGFGSLINSNGISRFGANFNYYSRYDRFLKNNNTSQFLIKNTGACSTMYNYNFNSPSLNLSILNPLPSNCILNETTCNNAIKYVGSAIVPVYTPNCFLAGSSLGHFEDLLYPTCLSPYGNDNYFAMSNQYLSTKRYLKPEERNVLCDIGYKIKTTFGSSATFSGTYDYGGTTSIGVNVVGINDGFNPDGTYKFLGNANTTPNLIINGNSLLDNDYNAVSFECLEDITSISSFSATSGNSSTVISINSVDNGFHLLRYVPINANGQRGNITYVYCYIRNNLPFLGTCAATTNACDFVSNGGFEQNSNLPAAAPGNNSITLACGWSDVTNSSTSCDYFHRFSTTSSLRVPCNAFGFEESFTAGTNAYAGLVYNSLNTAFPYKEILKTRLKTPLLPNTNYQLSFNVSISDGNNSQPTNMQAYLSNNDIVMTSAVNQLPITSTGLLLSNSSVSRNNSGWDTVVFNFTTPLIGLEYLYLGGINNNITVLNSIVPSTTGCSYATTPSESAYYYLDNVSLIGTNNSSLNIPANVCQIIPDLKIYLSGLPTNGMFSGLGVVASSTTPIVYSFNPVGLFGTQTTITYTVLNGGCNFTLFRNLNISNSVIPTFTTIAPICKNSIIPPLPTTSLNEVTGTWTPTLLNNQVTTTYTFTPNAGQCAAITTLIIPIRQPSTPSFNFGNTVNISCGNVPILYNISDNGVSGYWTPAIITSNYPSTYTFINSCGPNFVLNTSLASFPYLASSDYFTAQLYTNATTLQTSPGNFVNVLQNDATNALFPSLYAGITVNLVGVMPIPTTGSITLNSNGTISLGANTAPGTYNFSYNFSKACTTSNTVNVTLVIKAMVIFAPGEASLGNYCYSTSSYYTTSSVLKNIKFNAMPALASNSIITLLSSSMPVGLTLNYPSGVVTVAAGTQPGNYNFQYRVCSAVNPTNCSGTISANLTIKSTVNAYSDSMIVNVSGNPTITYPTLGAVNVLTNDIYGCNYLTAVSATLSNIVLTETTLPVNPYYGINSLGNVFRKPPTTAPLIIGNPSITLSYKICDPIFPLQICSFTNVFIEVRPLGTKGVNKTLKIDNNINLSNKIEIHPNPSSELFYLRFNNQYDTATVSVYNLIGQKIVEQTITKQLNYTLDLNNFSSGNYLIKIEVDNEIFTEKLIKQ